MLNALVNSLNRHISVHYDLSEFVCHQVRLIINSDTPDRVDTFECLLCVSLCFNLNWVTGWRIMLVHVCVCDIS